MQFVQKNRIVPVAFALVCALISTSIHAATIKIAGTEASFEAPADFTPLTDAQIKQKYPPTRAPAFVIGDATRATTIAYDVKPNALKDADLEKALPSFIGAIDKGVPGVVWKKREITQLAGQRWLQLEMTSNAKDTDIHNIMMVTPYDGKMLIFNFSSTREQFKKMESLLRTSINSIKLK